MNIEVNWLPRVPPWVPPVEIVKNDTLTEIDYFLANIYPLGLLENLCIMPSSLLLWSIYNIMPYTSLPYQYVSLFSLSKSILKENTSYYILNVEEGVFIIYINILLHGWIYISNSI